MDRPNWLRDQVLGRWMWPVVCALLVFSTIPACAAVMSPEDKPKRILNAASSLFTAALTTYLGLVPRSATENRSTTSMVLFVLALSLSFLAAVAAVVLACFDGLAEADASTLIQVLLGPVQNYIFAATLATHVVGGRGDGRAEMA